MGSKHSTPNRYNHASAKPLNATHHSNSSLSSIPARTPPRTITRFSELVDPTELGIFSSDEKQAETSFEIETRMTNIDSREREKAMGCFQHESKPKGSLIVKSPSGNLLSAQEFLTRPDRKLGIQERRRKILEEVSRKINDGEHPNTEKVMRKKEWRKWVNWWKAKDGVVKDGWKKSGQSHNIIRRGNEDVAFT